jgi:hypothetical protein
MTFDPNDLPERALQEVLAQENVSAVARQFLQHFYDGDLASAWRFTHPILRLCLGQWWVHANEQALRGTGHDIDLTVDQLAQTNGSHHDLWEHFSRVLLRDFRTAYPLDPAQSSIGSTVRMIDLDTELLYVHPDTPLGAVWTPGEERAVYPLVMGLIDGEWMVLNWASDIIPTPGYPPTLFVTQ